jgi:hypothetical protein
MLTQWFTWRNIFILTICFMAMHFLLYRNEYYEFQTSVEEPPVVNKPPPGYGGPGTIFAAPNPSGSQIESDDPPDAISVPHRKPTKVEAHPLVDVADNEKPRIQGNVDSKTKGKPSTPSNESTPPPVDAVPSDEYVAICIAVKDQALDLPEFFIHHYHHIGIRRFYVMDDGTEPPLSTIPYYGIPSTALTFEYQDPAARAPGHSQQLHIYQRCLENYGKKHTWMAFIDSDEFFETPGNETLKQILTKLEGNEKVGALGVNWQMHTSSGLLKRPQSARKSFVHCIWDDPENGGANSNNTHVKSIVKVEKAVRAFNPHMFVLKDGAQTVGENGDAIVSEAFRLPITRDRIALHHYAGKSREEYEAKMLRGNAMDDPKGEYFWNSLEHYLPHVNCTAMAKYDP